ncbi:MAG: glycosyltransferase family 2 protein [Candidatus Eisenbacteria bacterium]|nr:glycosyltransferase family 2 protein [Candidatus Eisenbacteria bacterium]
MNGTTRARKRPHLSVVIPAFNEEGVILSSLDKVHAYLSGRDYPFEILPVDDGSTDRTSELALDFAERHEACRPIRLPRNLGKGGAVRKGFEEARGRFILFTDADLSTPIHEIERFLRLLEEGYHVVIGSRDLPDSDVRVHQPWYRETMGKVFNRIVRVIVLRGFRDTQCGFKAFDRESVLPILNAMRINGFAFDVEMLYLARKMGLRLREEPITWMNSPDTRVDAVHDASRMFVDLLRIRYYDVFGRYRLPDRGLSSVDGRGRSIVQEDGERE